MGEPDGNALNAANVRVRSFAEAELLRLTEENVQLRAGLEELLDVAERHRGGDTNLDPERWYAARDYARKVLNDTA